ncbi:hypothetical protein ACQP2X_39245 [Actinoplanes sp. CA-131856]
MDDDGTPGAAPADVHFTAGQTAHIADEGIAIDVTVASPKIIKAPEFWSGTSVVIATVAINVTTGQFSYDETAFTLVLDDGTRIDASTVASDEGLPGKALGSGNLTAPDKAKGLITFSGEHLPKTLIGTKIQLRDDAAGRDWALRLTPPAPVALMAVHVRRESPLVRRSWPSGGLSGLGPSRMNDHCG